MGVIRRDDRVLCCCAGGKVRSVACKYVLEDRHGLRRVIACGLQKNDPETLAVLFGWADRILVVGERDLAELVPPAWRHKLTHLDVGPDVYGSYGDARLVARLAPMIAALVEG